ncbi:MAG TPA: hypothetical protein VMP89_07215 [Solirubrobacteraceae bacterium]|nr:hypothetical protein [Solirubrobacteraceae bacterium]
MAAHRPTRREVRLTERDLRLLWFLSEHRLALETHLQSLLGASADATRTRVRSLARGGFVAHRRVFDGEPAVCQIRRPGLEAIGSRLPAPRLNLAFYAHDVGAAWLWLAARGGSFGPMREVIGERVLRSHDGSADRDGEPYGVRLGGLGPRGQERLHYPDLLLVTPQGRRIAIELELTKKGRARREKILAGYGADSRIDAVLYLVEKPALRRAIEASAARVGVSDRVHVQYFRWADRKSGAASSGRHRSIQRPQQLGASR